VVSSVDDLSKAAPTVDKAPLITAGALICCLKAIIVFDLNTTIQVGSSNIPNIGYSSFLPLLIASSTSISLKWAPLKLSVEAACPGFTLAGYRVRVRTAVENRRDGEETEKSGITRLCCVRTVCTVCVLCAMWYCMLIHRYNVSSFLSFSLSFFLSPSSSHRY
jgi:hypothetical protein